MDEQAFKFSDLRGILRRRARTMAIVAGVVLFPAIFMTAIQPNRYVAFTTILIGPQAISRKLVETGAEEGDLTNRLHLITMEILSRSRLAKIIDDLSLYKDRDGGGNREQVIAQMRDQIWVQAVLPEFQEGAGQRSQPAEINTFRLFFRHENPQTAAEVANRISNDFLDEHIRNRMQAAGDTTEFIEGELERLTEQLREVETEIARFKAQNSGSLPEDRANNERRLLQSLDALRAAQRALTEAESDATFYRQQALMVRSNEGRWGDVGKSISPALRLQELDMTLGELRAKGFTDRHPDVVSTLAEMEQLRNRINSTDPEGPPTSVAEQEARGLAERAKARVETERQEIARIQNEIETIQDSLQRTPGVAEQLDGLMRGYASLSESFQNYSSKRLEATVAASMAQRQKGEQFRILEVAVVPSAPEFPNQRRQWLALEVLLSLVLAAVVAVLQEGADRSVHDARSLQERLRIPVLATVPAILLEPDRLKRRQRWQWEMAAAGIATITAVLASLVGYVYVNKPDLFQSDEQTQAAMAPTPPVPESAPESVDVPPAEAGTNIPSGNQQVRGSR
jgi:polysaccharide chain length determinant protein (PEP-CTERM system associated)